MKTYQDRMENQKFIGDLIHDEHRRQVEKWGKQNVTLFEWMNYLTEEVGELATAIADNEYRNGDVQCIVDEATQVATLAMKIISMVHHEKKSPTW